jgi:hypothetical protein
MKPLLALGILLAVLAVSTDSPAQYLEFKQVGSSIPSSRFFAIDLDGNGCDEVASLLFSPEGGNHVHIYRWDEDHLALSQQLSQDRSWSLEWGGYADVVGDGRPEVCLTLVKPDSLRIVILGAQPNETSLEILDEIRATRAELGGVLNNRAHIAWDVGAEVIGRLPAGDPASPVLVVLAAGFSKQPRGLAAFDARPPHRLVSRRRIGQLPMLPAFLVRRGSLADSRIVLAGAAPENNSSGPGLPDTVASVIATDGNGRILWTRDMGAGGAIPQITLADMNADGTPEVVVGCNQQVDGVGVPSGLWILGLEDGRVLEQIDSGLSVLKIGAADFDGDSKPEVVVLSDGAGLRIYDAKLNLLRSTDVSSDYWSFALADVDCDGRQEIYVGTEAATTFRVFDGSLRELGRISAGGAGLSSVQSFNLSRKKRLLAVATTNGTVVLFQQRRVSEPPWIAAVEANGHGVPAVWAAVAGFLTGIALVGALVGFRKLRAGGRTGELRRALVAELGIVRHGERKKSGQSEEPLNRLLRGLNTLCEPGNGSVGREIVESAGEEYEAFVAPALKRIVGMSPMVAPANLSIPLAIETLAVGRRVRRICRSLNRKEAADALPAECAGASRSVKRLSSLLERMDVAARSGFSADPYEEASTACACLQQRFAAAGVALDGIQVLGRVGAHVFFEQGKLRRCLHDILVNAIEACEDCKDPVISIRIACGEKRVVIQIVDNGRGVPEEQMEAIFHGRSTKIPPGGTGLSHARRTVDSFSGKIFMRESTPWGRTVMELDLCRATS